MCPDPHYDEPFHWWGPGWDAPPVPSIGDLLRDGTIDSGTAAVLWSALARRRSLAVIAGPSGAGKTMVLTALLAFLPANTRRIYLRGCFETFAFLSDPAIDPAQTALLINEISPHLPVYLWGPAVAGVLEAADVGFALLATAHAASVPEFVATMTGSPLRIAAPRVAAFEFVVALEKSAASEGGHRVGGLWRLSRTRDGVSIVAAAPHGIPQESPPLWFPERELQQRRRQLIDLRDGRLDRLPPLPARAEAET